MDELLAQAAEKLGMPPALAQRSAQARAEKEGITVEAVLREWAGQDAGPSDTANESTETETAPDAAATEEPTAPSTGDTPAETAPTEVTTDYLVALASEAKRMPEKLVRSSAEARARNAHTSVDSVLATWAGVDLADLEARVDAGEPLPVAHPESAAAPEEPTEPVRAAEQASVPAPAAPAPAVAMSIDELLDKAAEAKGLPAPLAKRSAEARAKKTGEPVEAVLAEWAGIDPAAVTATAPPSPPSEATPAASGPTTVDETPTADDDVEVLAPERLAESPDEGVGEFDDDDRMARRGGYPTWLAAAFVLIPLLAVTYILVSPNGPDCGSAGQLRIDESSGLAVNCDGSDYGSSEVNFLAQGGAIFAQCAACHGSNGEGGVGPAFAGGAVLSTFPAGQCSTHIEWVTLGSSGWPDPTYGATGKPVGAGGMPSFGATLSDEEIASVVLYERVTFGGENLDEAQVDCGLVAADGGDTSTQAAGE
jgi:mono/diheme cytochrome c family protein